MNHLPHIATLSVAVLTIIGPVNPGLGQEFSPPATSVDPPARIGSMAPNLTTDGDAALMSWLEPAGDTNQDSGHRLRFARFVDGVWSDARTIVEGVEFFANWADIPALAVAADGDLLAGWLEKSGPGTYAYDVRLARSTDGGDTWTHLGPAHNDGVQAEHGFMSFVPEADGIRAFWLDGRRMTSAGDDATDGHGEGAMTLRTATITDRVANGIQLDARVCECCPTAAAMTSRGPAVVYRDRGPGEERDIWIVRYDGMEWTTPRPVHADNWVIPGCPVNGPAIAAHESTVAVAWYTAANNAEKVLLSFSSNDGESFAAPIIVDDTRPAGRVALTLDETGDALVCWLDAAIPDGAIRARRVSRDGSLGSVATLTTSTTARAGGRPALLRLGGTMLLTWTDPLPAMKLRAITFDAASLPGGLTPSTAPED